jgi:hypothetical protein
MRKSRARTVGLWTGCEHEPGQVRNRWNRNTLGRAGRSGLGPSVAPWMLYATTLRDRTSARIHSHGPSVATQTCRATSARESPSSWASRAETASIADNGDPREALERIPERRGRGAKGAPAGIHEHGRLGTGARPLVSRMVHRTRPSALHPAPHRVPNSIPVCDLDAGRRPSARTGTAAAIRTPRDRGAPRPWRLRPSP